ncbi:MAG: TRM11 family methyltransferase [Planctomycetota bacterium]|jgi:hypothetical protein
MSDTPILPQVDQQVVDHIQGYSDEFWASTDRDPRDDVHAYFQYPAMMVPGIQRELIRLMIELQPMIGHVIDPFVGAGTTMTACMPLGANFMGQDINPLAVLVSRTKKGPYFHKALSSKAMRVLSMAKTDRSEEIEASFDGLDKWFKPGVQVDLSKIRRAIRSEKRLWARRFLWVALAETVRLTSNSRTSTYKLHTRPEAEIATRTISAIEKFSDIVSQNLEDFLHFRDTLCAAGHLRRGHYTGTLSIHLKDSASEIMPSTDLTTKYDLLITSPPYGDNTSTVPYGQHSYLPLQWIDLEDIDAQADTDISLRTTHEIDRRSLGGRYPRNLASRIAHLVTRSSCYQATMEALANKPRDRRARVTVFLYDLDRALDPIVESLRENAYLIWFIGNRHVGGIEIPTDAILVELLGHYGVRLVTRANRQIMFRRMAARNRIAGMMRQEHILVFRKTGE